LNQVDEIKIKRTPGDDMKRMLGLTSNPYPRLSGIDPTTRPQWPHTGFADAVNDYSGRYHQGYITSAVLKKDDPDLYGAIEHG
jgi:hypothetical protein